LIFPRPGLCLLAVIPASLSLLSLSLPLLNALAWGSWAVLVAVAASDARALVRRTPLRVERVLPARARVGQPCRIEYAIEASERLQVTLLDELPEDLGGDHGQGWVQLAAGGETLRAALTPTRRGLRTLGPCHVLAASPLGLWARRLTTGSGQQLAVLPEDTLPQRRGFTRHQLRSQLGLRPRRPRGEGSDFESLRPYVPDDEPRRIDWRASARARQLVVRNYHVERDHTLLVAVDCGRLMGTHVDGCPKLDHALAAAIGLVRAGARAGDRAGFVAFDKEVRAWVPPQPPRRALGPILQATLPLHAQPYETSYRALSETLLQRQKKRSLLVILTDFVESSGTPELEGHLASLARRHVVLLVGVRDRMLKQIERPAPDVDGLDLYKRLVLQDLDVARDVAMTRIARHGVHTLDLDPAAITVPLLDRYLGLRELGVL
jgi:uncharacterized protein (DUF58 family)